STRARTGNSGAWRVLRSGGRSRFILSRHRRGVHRRGHIKSTDGNPRAWGLVCRYALAFGELEGAAGAFEAVLLAFFHAAVAGEIAGVAELLGHAAGGFTVGGLGAGLAEHVLEGTGDALANSAGLAREAAAVNAHEHVE